MLTIKTTAQIFIALILLAFSTSYADEKQSLETLLIEFLAGQTEAHHERFWADELIYTSSSGTRFGKADIMASFATSDSTDNAESEAMPQTQYSAENIDIRVHDSYAIVAFKVIAKQGGKVIQTYWNTGTFAPREAGWQAIAWQATMIPNKQDKD